MGFTDNEGKPGNFAEQYNSRREHHLSSLQQKEEEMRQKFVIRVKEKEAELKEAEKEVISAIINYDLPEGAFTNYVCILWHLTRYLLVRSNYSKLLVKKNSIFKK
jgi:hypothetical protein